MTKIEAELGVPDTMRRPRFNPSVNITITGDHKLALAVLEWLEDFNLPEINTEVR